MSILSKVKNTTQVQETVEEDRLGGASLLDSDVYLMTVKGAYFDESAGGAMCMVLALETETGKQHRETVYFTNKAGETYYVDKNDPKKTHYLPGYLILDSLCMLVNETPLLEQNTEVKQVKIYDRELGKEIPQNRDVCVDMLNQQVKVAILRQTVNKQVKNAAGTYVPTAETREENVIAKYFHAETDQTYGEATQGIEGGVFMAEWLKKYQGVTLDKVKPADPSAVGGKSSTGKPTSAPAERKPSIFNKK